jgi:crossover junction endodeoxyribonuclease RuvC
MAILVLGVDPGTRYTGYGLVRGEGQSVKLVTAGTIVAGPAEEFPAVLRQMYRVLVRLIREHRPDEVAVEEAFVHRNPRSALQTGSVRGVALLAAAEARLPIGEYNPQAVKISVVGRGGATKEQVGYMVRTVLGRSAEGYDPHACDALAVALCHLWRRERAARLKTAARATGRARAAEAGS